MITREDIQGLFPKQLKSIKDEELREKVVTAWVLGCERGGWEQLSQLKAMPFTLLVDCYRITFIEHTIAVTEGAVGLAKAQMDAYRHPPYKIDLDRLYAGALLHDVGKLLETEPDGKGGYRVSRSGRLARHPISGTWLAQEAGLPEEIMNTIVCHSKEGEGSPQLVETILIHQADFATFDPLVFRANGKLID
jgi:putative nucleotidyltransferase with HDIG domain